MPNESQKGNTDRKKSPAKPQPIVEDLTEFDDPIANRQSSETEWIEEENGTSESNQGLVTSISDEILVVYDEVEQCPYIAERQARMPLGLPLVSIDAQSTDRLMSGGFRRSGHFLYQTNCTDCQACEAIRLDVNAFQPNRSQRRALKKGDKAFEVVIGTPQTDRQRVHLFNKHRNARGLNCKGIDIDDDDYQMFLIESCLDTFEIAYYCDSQLVGIAICDQGEQSISAVYTYYDIDFVSLSPGTYSIMKQVEKCKSEGFQYLYLGFYIAQCQFMRYKQNFRPHQRLIDGQWKDFH